MSNQDKSVGQGAGPASPERPSWGKRHGTEMIIVVFFLLTALIVAYEAMRQ